MGSSSGEIAVGAVFDTFVLSEEGVPGFYQLRNVEGVRLPVYQWLAQALEEHVALQVPGLPNFLHLKMQF